MNKKKVLLIVPLSTLEWGTKNMGGVDSVCQMIVRELQLSGSEGFYYRVVAFDPTNSINNAGAIVQLNKQLEVVQYNVSDLSLGYFKLPGFLHQRRCIVEQEKLFMPDVIHAHIASWLLSMPNTRKRIATLHSYKTICRKSRSLANDFLNTKIMPWLSQQFIDRYTCVGEILEDSLRIDTSKPIDIIGNPIDDDYFSPQTSNQCADSQLMLVTCALISRRKRIDLAIDLIAAMKKQGVVAFLRVIGPNADTTYFAELQEQVAILGLVDNVEFIGALNKPAIIKEYQHADIAVFFSEQETFGLAPLEALASGLPLLTTAVGILSERKSDFERLGVEYINKYSVASQLEAIERLKSVDTSDSVKYIKNEFTAKSVVASYENLYG